jgi:formiminoglutamate deiminase
MTPAGWSGPSASSASSGPPGPAWHAELAWLPGGVRRDVLIETSGPRITAVTQDTSRPPSATRLPGLTLPGLANVHSHAFHRALRGLTQAGRGTFWTWRERMYEVAARLTPDTYLDLATAVYAEMALAGITCVGEFHYLHHTPGGTPYADPAEMSRALIEAARRAGIRICLLDTCYLSGGLTPAGTPIPLSAPQLRFADPDAAAWSARASLLLPPAPAPPVSAGPASARPAAARAAPAGPDLVRLGAAIHSVRAVPPAQLAPVVAWSRQYDAPLHFHLSEQVAENQACQAAYGATPATVLARAGALGPRSTAIHATHLTPADIALLGATTTAACFCPTTEADLADGIGPAAALAAAGAPLTLGTDSQAVIDLLEEARRVEQGERLVTHQRGHFPAAALATAATAAGHARLGWPDAGHLTPGHLADLVTIALDTPRTAAATPATALETAIFAATAADVRTVICSGREIVRDGRHLLLPSVPAALSAAIRAVRSA